MLQNCNLRPLGTSQIPNCHEYILCQEYELTLIFNCDEGMMFDVHTNKCEKEEHADCPCVDFDINSDIVEGEAGGSESGVGGVATT